MFKPVPWKKSHSCKFGIILGDFLFNIENGILYVLIRITLLRRFLWEHTKYFHVKENQKDIPLMPLDLVLWLTLISSNYPCLEHIFMVPEVFEPLKFYCIAGDIHYLIWELSHVTWNITWSICENSDIPFEPSLVLLLCAVNIYGQVRMIS